MQKNSSINRRLTTKQERFIRAVEGIGDILVFETRNKKRNTTVKQGLERIQELAERLFDIKESDPEKFNRLLLSQEYLRIYKEKPEEAQFRLALNPDEYLVSFYAAITQFLRIHEAALTAKNDEISRFATYHLIFLLAHIIKTPNNHFFAEQILRSLSDVTREAAEKQDISVYAASGSWYIDLVFNKLGADQATFDLGYLALFDNYFLSTAKYVIREGHANIFKSIISSLVDGLHTFPSETAGVWKYQEVLLSSGAESYRAIDEKYGLSERFHNLAESAKTIGNLKELTAWKDNFVEMTSTIIPEVAEGLKAKLREAEEQALGHVQTEFKYKNLISLVFALGAYCLFKERYEYIKYAWEYKQPSDADAKWIGTDIIPEDLGGVIQAFLREDFFERRHEFWEEHHGSELYYTKYFLLSLARILRPMKPNNEGGYPSLDQFVLPQLDIHQLNRIIHSNDELARDAEKLKEDALKYVLLGFEIGTFNELVDTKLVPLILKIGKQAKQQILQLKQKKEISAQKVEEFRTEFVASFYENSDIRNIFRHYGLYNDQTGVLGESSSYFGLRQIEDKAVFFDDWPDHYANWGSSYGDSFARQESTNLVNAIRSLCRSVDESEIDKTLSSVGSEGIIFASASLYQGLLSNMENFRAPWHPECLKNDLRSFGGCYLKNGIQIPIFRVLNAKADEESIVILNKSKLGRLIQEDAVKDGEPASFRKDIFYLGIQSFAKDSELVAHLIKESPEWLRNKGDERVQREYLLEKVLIEIRENYKFAEAPDFEGFILGQAPTAPR